MDGRMNGWMDGWTDGWTGVRRQALPMGLSSSLPIWWAAADALRPQQGCLGSAPLTLC